jgi:hypothetical protein
MSILNISSAALSSANIGRGLLAFAIASGVLWFIGSYILDKLRVKSLIRNLPTLGRGHWFSGNLLELFDIGNIGFHSEAKKRYGGALVIHGILGVSNAIYDSASQTHTNAGRANILLGSARDAPHINQRNEQFSETIRNHCVSALTAT